MKQKDTPIQRKLLRVMMMTCGSVLLLTCAAFIIYEFITYREIMKRELTTLGEIIATNSTASLAFDNKEDADELLNGLQAQKNIVAACLYDKDGNIFTVYPKTLSPKDFPLKSTGEGYAFENNFLTGYQPVIQGNDRLGTLYLKSDMNAVYNRFSLYGIIAGIFIILSFIFAYLLSKRLQRSISVPILELAEKARIVSEKKDYSIRADKTSDDEIGVLTDAFNHMLTQIEAQTAEINNLNSNLEEKVTLRTTELQTANTTLKEQNEFIETIIDSSVDLIAVFNKNLDYLIVNKQSDDIYHIKKEDLIGQNLLEVFPKLKDSTMVENLRKAFTGVFVQQDVYKSLVSDRYFENFFIPLKDKDGNTDRVLAIGHDITTIIQATEKLKVMNMALEKSNRDLEQFAYVASHDLQEPLRKIQTFAELSEKNVEHPVILKRYLQKINSSANRMSELIKAVLNYSRLAQTENEFVDVDLNDVVSHIKTDLELLVEEKKAVITSNNLPVIKAIPLQIGQLFLNLISNSLKFCKNQPEINITGRVLSYQEAKKETGLKIESNYLQLIFCDNGIGFDQQYADRVFSIFQRLHPTSEYAGTGIGLALCKKIVENHNGLITVESEPNKGTSFFIYLPLIDQPAQNGKIVQHANDLVRD